MSFFGFDHEEMRFVGRWAPYNGAMTATATGSRIKFAFEGELAVLHFDTRLQQTPAPHLYIRVDGGAFVEVTLEQYVRVRAVGAGRHTVEVILKSMVEMFPRWHWPLVNRVSFLGVEAEGLTKLPRPAKKKKTIEFVGDSITEGVLIDPNHAPQGKDQVDRPFQDDVTATYAWLLAEKLELEPLMMGYGAVGVTKGGCGGVPCAAQAYPFCFEGAPVTGPHPDYVFINHGTNDGGRDAVTFTAGYVALLDAIFTAHPKARVFAMTPFCGAHEENIEKLVADYRERHQKDIHCINGSHWLPPDPVHPLRDGHALAAEKLAEALKPLL